MNVEDVKKALLNAAGNPESGAIADLADVLSQAVIDACCPTEAKAFNPVAETRVVEITETR